MNIYKKIKKFLLSNYRAFVTLIMMGVMVAVRAGVLSDVSGAIQDMRSDAEDICKAVAVVLAVIGAGTIYYKVSNGDQDVKKTAILTIGGAAAFAALSEALPALIGG